MAAYVGFDNALYASFVILGLAAWLLWRNGAPRPAVELLPLPPGAEFVWGHEKQVFMHEPGRAFKRWAQELGLTYRIKAALRARDVLVLSDPGGIAHILQENVFDYHHSAVVRPRIGRLLGKGLGWVEGEAEHRRMRRLLSPSFSVENMKLMAPQIKEATLRVMEDLTQHVQSHNGGIAVNMVDWMAKATLNIIGRAAFQFDFEGGNSEAAQRIINARKRGVSPAVQYAGFLTLMLLRRFPLLNRLPIKAIQAQGLAKMTIQSGVAREMTRRNERVAEREATNSRGDLLSRLLVARAEGKIEEEELYEQISTFIVAGHETTTQALSFTAWELSRHPQVQARVRAELAAFPQDPTYDDYQMRLPYLDAVLKETLRLYPGLPYMERVAQKTDVIPLRQPVRLSDGRVTSELVVSPGQVVLIPILSIQRLDTVWKDGDSFRPERWLEDLPPKHLLVSGWSNTLAFSDGPRVCVGMRLAIYQYKVILVELLRRFEFGDTGEDITLKIASSLQGFVADKKEMGPCLPVCLTLL